MYIYVTTLLIYKNHQHWMVSIYTSTKSKH